MDGTNNTNPYNVEGYVFYTERDAELAKIERKKIDYLKERMDYSKPESVLRVYSRAITERVFKTPVGVNFLYEIREFLLGCPDIGSGSIPLIPISAVCDNEVRETVSPAKKRVKPSVKKEKSDLKKQMTYMSVLLNIVLIIAVIAMFIITINSDQPNILNYEKAITNRYAYWEQELTERERVVREKEREFNIENNN